MPARNCVYCSKTLPRELRKDAMYCPGSKCRVYAHRRRVLLGEKPPTRKRVCLQTFRLNEKADLTKQTLAQLQLKRKRTKLPPLITDPYMQAKVEREAYEILTERLSNLDRDARNRVYAAKRNFYGSRDEYVLDNHAKIEAGKSVTHIGLYVMPSALGGGAVLHTARCRA